MAGRGETGSGATGVRAIGVPNGAVAALSARRFARDRSALYVLELVAQNRKVALQLLLHRSRGRANVALARQLAMYLVHVDLGRTLTQVGVLFGRDRTTVAHACALIEDLREGQFDREVDCLEATISTATAGGANAEEMRHAG